MFIHWTIIELGVTLAFTFMLGMLCGKIIFGK